MTSWANIVFLLLDLDATAETAMTQRVTSQMQK